MSEYLYHYTDVSAMMNMASNEQFEMWASRYDFLNDEDEINYGLEIFRETCEIEDYPFEKLKDSIQYLLKATFVLSFSVDNDSLPLWSYYSKLDGLCLGVEKNGIISESENATKGTFRNKDAAFFHGKVLYEVEEQKETARKVWDMVQKPYSNISPKINTDFYFQMIHAILRMKSAGFSAENEYRFVFVLGAWGEEIHEDTCYLRHVNYRERNGYIVPYIKIPFIKEIIETLTLGPTNRCELRKNSISEFLKVNNIIIKPIDLSTIPLRF